MSETSESLRRRIDSASELGSVVRTMKALSASGIAQYERAVASLEDYYRTVELGLVAWLRQDGAGLRAAETRTDGGVCGAVVFGSDQGLVGQFNETLADFAAEALGAMPGGKKIWAVGERMQGCLAPTDWPVADGFAVPNSTAAITSLVGRILASIEAQRGEGGASRVYLFYNRPAPGGMYRPVQQQLLPLDDAWRSGLSELRWPGRNLPEIVGGSEAVLRALIREYLFISLFRACAESLASENASRLAAMQRAEKNIDEALDDLKRSFQRERQSGIDEELFDVISGFEALEEDRRCRPESRQDQEAVVSSGRGLFSVRA